MGKLWFMRTNVRWAMKSQQPFAMDWAIERRDSINSESIRG